MESWPLPWLGGGAARCRSFVRSFAAASRGGARLSWKGRARLWGCQPPLSFYRAFWPRLGGSAGRLSASWWYVRCGGGELRAAQLTGFGSGGLGALVLLLMYLFLGLRLPPRSALVCDNLQERPRCGLIATCQVNYLLSSVALYSLRIKSHVNVETPTACPFSCAQSIFPGNEATQPKDRPITPSPTSILLPFQSTRLHLTLWHHDSGAAPFSI